MAVPVVQVSQMSTGKRLNKFTAALEFGFKEEDYQLILGVTQDSGGSQYSISKMLCYAQSTQKVASVVVIPGPTNEEIRSNESGHCHPDSSTWIKG